MQYVYNLLTIGVKDINKGYHIMMFEELKVVFLIAVIVFLITRLVAKWVLRRY
jgi:hypothetical protein